MHTIHISYGLLSGKHALHPFIQALQTQGITCVNNPVDADILLGYSGGCFYVLRPIKQQKVVLVNPPYWPGKSVLKRTCERAMLNAQPKRFGYSWRTWLVRQLWVLYYLVTDFPRNVRVAQDASKYNLETAVQTQPTDIIRSRHDNWLTPNFAALRQANPATTFYAAPGDHEGIIYFPGAYVDIIKELLA